MADPPRARRLAKRIAQIVASSLEHEVKDPRLAMVTITDAKVTGDLRDATVYYTVLGPEEDRAAAAARLAETAPQARAYVAHHVRLRHAPTLEFVSDDLPARGVRIDQLLQQIGSRDDGTSEATGSSTPTDEEDPSA
jgi:ribosome-binding factor A